MDLTTSKEAEAMASGSTLPPVTGTNGVTQLPFPEASSQYPPPTNTEYSNFRNVDLGPGYGSGVAAPVPGEKGFGPGGPALPPYSYSKESFAPPSYDALGRDGFGPQPIFMQPGREQGQPGAYYNMGGSWEQGAYFNHLVFGVQKFRI